MPKDYPASFKETQQAASRRHVSLYRVTLFDGTIYRFADNDQDISATVSGSAFTFQAFGHKRDSVETHANLQIDEMDITVPNVELIMQDNVTRKRLGDFALQGLLDNAKIEIFVWDADNPTANVIVHSTWLVQQTSVTRAPDEGSVTLRCESQFVTADRESPRTLYQELCNNSLYDKFCAVSRAAFEVTTTIWGGTQPQFVDLFNRTALGSDWTQDGTGTVTLDGFRISLDETTQTTERLAVRRDIPSGRPVMAEVDIIDVNLMSLESTNPTFVFGIGDNIDPLTNAYRIDFKVVETSPPTLRMVINNSVLGTVYDIQPVPTTLKLRLFYNDVTVWSAYSQDDGATWKLMDGITITPATPRFWLIDNWPTSAAQTPTKFDNYREWSGGDIGIQDIITEPTASALRIQGGQSRLFYDLGEVTMQTGALLNVRRSIKSHEHLAAQVARFAKTTYSVAPNDDTGDQGKGDPNRRKMVDLQEARQDENIVVARWTNAAGSSIDITLDFGAARTYKVLEVAGSATDATAPTQVEFFKSTDGVGFTSLGTVLAAAKTRPHNIWPDWFRYTLTLGSAESTRYVRARVTREGTSDVILSEFRVTNPTGEELLTLLHALPLVPASGDSIKVAPGCDKRLTTCKNKFNNLVPAGGGGFRGFPTIPKPTDTF